VLSASGGAGALLADHSSEQGITMAEFNGATVDRLETILPSFARKTNPIDLTGQVNTAPDMLKDACKTVVADPRTEAVIVQFASTVRRHLLANAEVFKALARKVPVFLSIMGEAVEPEIRKEQGPSRRGRAAGWRPVRSRHRAGRVRSLDWSSCKGRLSLSLHNKHLA
jgi:acyl-CoA synthetase (NDP forming)